MQQQDALKESMSRLESLQQQQIQILAQMSSNQNQQIMTQQRQITEQQQRVPNMAPPQFNTNPVQPNFAPPGMFAAPYNQLQHAQQQFQQLSPSSGKYGFLDSFMVGGTSVSAGTRAQIATDWADRASQAGFSGAGALATSAMGIGGAAMFGGIAGLGVGLAGGVAVGSYVDAGVNEMKKQSAYQKYLMRESYRIISPEVSNNERGIAGFNMSESQNASTFLRNLAPQNYMKDSELMSVFQKFTEGGMLKDTKDLTHFKEKMQSLTKTVKEGALILNETYDSIAGLMSEFKKAGIDTKDFSGLMGTGKLLGGLMGVDASQIVRDIVDAVKKMNSGTGASNDDTISRTTDTFIYMQKWYKDLQEQKKDDPKMEEMYNLIVNSGGVSGASTALQQSMEQLVGTDKFRNAALAFFDYGGDGRFQFNTNSFSDYLKNPQSYQSLMDRASEKLNNAPPSAALEWQNNAGTYIKNNMQHGQMTSFIGQTVDAYRRSTDDAANLNFEQVLGMMGVNDSSTRNLLSGYVQYRGGEGSSYGNYMRLNSLWETANAQYMSNKPSIDERFSSGWDKAIKGSTQWMVDLGDTFKRSFVEWSDKVNGVDFSDRQRPTNLQFNSNLTGFGSEEVDYTFKQINASLKSSAIQLDKLIEHGYATDDLKGLQSEIKKLNAEGSVAYKRDKIVNWEDVVESVRGSKKDIIASAEKSSISESILAALVKYDQQSGKKVTSDKIANMADKLGGLVMEYGGNNKLALAAYNSDQSTIDNALKKAGYDMSQLRRAGAQGAVSNINLDQLDLPKDIADSIKKQVKDILGQVLTGGGGTAGTSGSSSNVSGNDFKGATANTQKHRELINSVADSYGINRLQLAALMSTEHEAGNASVYKNNGPEGGIFGITQLGVNTVNSMINKGYRSKSTNEQVTSIDQVLGNAGLQIDMTGTMFKQRLDRANGNAALAYAFYNGNQDKVAKDLERIGFTKDKYGNATDEETLEAIRLARGEGHESYKATKRYIKMKNAEAKISAEESKNKPESTSSGNPLQTTTEVVRKNADGTEYKVAKIEDISNTEFFRQTRQTLSLFNDTQLSSSERANKEKELFELAKGKLSWSDKMFIKKNSWVSEDGLNVSIPYDTKESGFIGDAKKNAMHQSGAIKRLFKDKAPEEYQAYLDYVEWNKSIGSNEGKGKNQSMTMDSQRAILSQLGSQFGIDANSFSNMGEYNSAIMNKARTFYNQNYDSMNAYMSGKSGTSEYKRWDGMGTNDKAMMMELMKVIEGLDVLKPSLKGDGKVSSIDERKTMNEKDKETMSYLSKEKDESGKETGRIIFDGTKKTNDESITYKDLIKFQEGGKTNVALNATINKALESSGSKLDVNTLSIGQSVDVIDRQMKEMSNMNIKKIQEFSEITKALESKGVKGDYAALLASPSSESSMKEIDAMKKRNQEAYKSGNIDESKFKSTNDFLTKLSKLANEIGGADTSGLDNIIKQLKEIQKVAEDTGNFAKLASASFMDKEGRGSFDEDIKKLITKEMKDAGIKDMAGVLQLVADGGVKGEFSMSPEALEELATNISKATETGISKSLNSKEGIEKVNSYLKTQDDPKNKEIIKKTDNLVSFIEKKEAELKKDMPSRNLLDEYNKEIAKLQTDITQMLGESIKNTGDAKNQAVDLVEGTDDLGNLMGKYVSQIKGAISVLEKEVKEGKTKQPIVPPGPRGGIIGMISGAMNRNVNP
ncbi:MAG: hypothetical protein RR420_00730 [Anaerovoracaceae bacterium]